MTVGSLSPMEDASTLAVSADSLRTTSESVSRPMPDTPYDLAKQERSACGVRERSRQTRMSAVVSGTPAFDNPRASGTTFYFGWTQPVPAQEPDGGRCRGRDKRDYHRHDSVRTARQDKSRADDPAEQRGDRGGDVVGRVSAMTGAVSPAARAAAARLAGLFARDQELAVALNEAHARLLDANDRLTSGLSAEALLGVYGPGGPDLGLSGERPPVLRDEFPVRALEQVAEAIRVAHNDYQRAGEDRRLLAFDVGDAAAELRRVLVGEGFSELEARRADVAALAEGLYRPGSGVAESG